MHNLLLDTELFFIRLHSRPFLNVLFTNNNCLHRDQVQPKVRYPPHKSGQNMCWTQSPNPLIFHWISHQQFIQTSFVGSEHTRGLPPSQLYWKKTSWNEISHLTFMHKCLSGQRRTYIHQINNYHLRYNDLIISVNNSWHKLHSTQSGKWITIQKYLGPVYVRKYLTFLKRKQMTRDLQWNKIKAEFISPFCRFQYIVFKFRLPSNTLRGFVYYVSQQ